jgi:TolB-like protein
LLLLGFILGSNVGCGYRLVGQGSVLPDRIRTLIVAPFENRTQRPQIEQLVTEQVAVEFAKRGKYSVVSNRAEADAIVEGAITEYHTVPVRFTDDLVADRVEAIVRVQATVRDLASDAILWSQGGFIFKEQYEIPQGEGVLAEESVALDQIANGVAQALVTSILEGF